MLRFIIAAIWVVLFLIVSIPIQLILLITGLFSKKAKAQISQSIICAGFKGVKLLAGTSLLILGKENIPNDRAALFVPNHRSVFDIILTYPLWKRQTAYVAKKEIKKVPVFSAWMSFMNCQFLDRKDLRAGLKVILKCVDLINEGINVVIFPEGTRNKGGEALQPFHDGSLKIAEKAGCPIIPVAINNSDGVFEKQFPKLKKQIVTIEFCKPVYPNDFPKDKKREVSLKVQEEILEAYKKNKDACK